MKERSRRVLLGGVLAAALSLGGGSAWAGERDDVPHGPRIWAPTIWVRLRAEPCEGLALCIRQQVMSRLNMSEEIGARKVSIFAPKCTLKDLRDGLKAEFGYRLEAIYHAESIHFQLLSGPVPPVARSGKSGGAALASSPRTAADPKLQEKLDLSSAEIEEEEGGLPQVLQCLSEGAGILIMADYNSRADACPKGMTVSQFLASLKGLTLGEALDRTARAFQYQCSRSGRWFLFRHR